MVPFKLSILKFLTHHKLAEEIEVLYKKNSIDMIISVKNQDIFTDLLAIYREKLTSHFHSYRTMCASANSESKFTKNKQTCPTQLYRFEAEEHCFRVGCILPF